MNTKAVRHGKQQVLKTLEKFRRVDKYQAFREIMPEVVFSGEDQKEAINAILDACCKELIELFEAARRPTKPVLKKLLILYMDELTVASVNTVDREFGYQLGWYLAEKVAVDLRKGTEKKIWGYWEVTANEVIAPVKPRISRRQHTAEKEEAASSASVPDEQKDLQPM